MDTKIQSGNFHRKLLLSSTAGSARSDAQSKYSKTGKIRQKSIFAQVIYSVGHFLHHVVEGTAIKREMQPKPGERKQKEGGQKVP